MSDVLKSRLDWIVSYPKSGNTWCRMLLSAYFGGSANDVRFGIDLGEHFFGTVSTVPIPKLTVAQQFQLRGAALLAMAHANRGARTLVKSHHLNGTMHGVPTFSPLWTGRVIYVVRDPRDVLPSWAHHADADLEEIANDMADDGTGIHDDERGTHHVGSWGGHVRSWLDNAPHQVNVLTVRYEDLQEDTAGELERMLEHLDVEDVDQERVEAAVEATDFDRLKDTEDEVGFPEAPEGREFFRKGESGGWREEVPGYLVARIERHHGEMMERLGYEREAVTVG